MEQEIKIGKKIFIRNAGKDEYWLQEIIYADPERLGLGELVTVRKEKPQVKGGRLDILLKDQVDNTMYEVEVMLGETDPSHIIWTIEYWDNEKYGIMNEDGNMVQEKDNPYGIIPFVFTHREDQIDSFFVEGASDIINCNEQVNIALTELNLGMRFNMFGQPWVTGLNSDQSLLLLNKAYCN